MEENITYYPPQIELIIVEVEQGFAASYNSGNSPLKEQDGIW